MAQENLTDFPVVLYVKHFTTYFNGSQNSEDEQSNLCQCSDWLNVLEP